MGNRSNLFFLLICLIPFALFSCNESPVGNQGSGITNTGNGVIGSGNTSFSTIAGNLLGDQPKGPRVDSAKFLVEFVKLRSTTGFEHMFREEQLLMRVRGTSLEQVYMTWVPPGTYNWFQFKLHKHTPGDPVLDPDFGGEHEVGLSGVIKGVYNHVPFVYRTDITDVEHMNIDPPITVMPNFFDFNFTMNVSTSMWFVRDGLFIDPSDPANKHDIDQNIRNSFRLCFRDNNRDGQPDNGLNVNPNNY